MSDWMKSAETRRANVARLLARGPAIERCLHARSSNNWVCCSRLVGRARTEEAA